MLISSTLSVTHWAAWFVQCSLFCHVLAVIDTSIPRLSAWLIWSDSLRHLGVCICNSISHTSNKLAAKGAKDQFKNFNHIQIVTPCVSLMIHLHFGKPQHLIMFTPWTATCKTKTMEAKDEWKNKGGEPYSVSTATMIDILQVEQLSSDLTAAS